MTQSTLPTSLAAIAARGRIDDADVRAVRAAVYADGVVGPTGAEWVVALDEAARETSEAWQAFFAEVLVDVLVRQERPEGYVSDANAAWLIERLSRDGAIKGPTELDALVKVLESAVSVPPSLSAFALRQVADAVLTGAGPLARCRTLTPGVIGRDEVELLRRILFAAGGQDGLAVSRAEAEVLFDLNDASREAENDPAWSDLFVKAVANYLMAARGYLPPPRAEALRREAWLDAPAQGVGGFLGEAMAGLLAGGLRSIWRSALRPGPSAMEVRNAAVMAEMGVAEIVSADEVKWLADRIGRDGVIHANERALLGFLREESPDIHPSLRTLLDTAA